MVALKVNAAGVVKVTFRLTLLVLPTASVTVALKLSVRFSPQPRLALKLPACAPLTLIRLPVSLVHV